MTAMRIVDTHFGYEETKKVKIGKSCIIRPFTTIGYEGFGIIRDKNTGVPSQLAHYGGVVIGDNVRIGSNCCIDRGTKPHTPTTIGNNVMIDNLVHIAHNAVIGDGTIIVAHTTVGGTCKIGKNCFIGEGARIKQHVTIGDQVIVGAGAVVLKDVPDRDIVVGVPARSIYNEWKLKERQDGILEWAKKERSSGLSDEDRFRMVGY